MARTEAPAMPLAPASSSWRRVWTVLGANGFGQAVTIGTQLVSLPLFLAFWDLHQYGLWLLISSAPAYFSLADVGVGTVAMNRMTMFAAQGREHEAGRVFQVALGMTAASTLLLLALALLVIWGLAPGPLQDPATRMTLSLLVVATLAATFTPLVDGQFRAAGQSATGTLSIHLSRLVEWSGGIAGLVMFRTMVAVAAGTLLARLVATLAMVLWTRHHFPRYRWQPATPAREELRELVPQAAAFLALPVGNTLILQGVNMVVGSIFGPAALAVFSSFRTLSRVPVQLLTMFSRSVWPEMSRSYGAGDLATLGNLYRKSSRISLLGCAAICVVIYFAAPLLLQLWSHGKIAMDAPLLAMLLAAALAGCAWQVEQVLLAATNTHVRLSFWYLLVAVAVVLSSMLLPARFGMEAVVALLLLLELIMLAISHRMIAIPLRGGR
jgi:O-antigen/teichoic acid export membrane protein